MTKFALDALKRLHARLGDFWWYSLMLFCACRAADLLNAFVGLWLVPKYVGSSELGAVMPLSSFAVFLALPVSIFATAFMKEITVLATHGEYGKMKSLMRGVFICAGAFLILALLTTRFVLPAFLMRIRVAEGSLGILIISTAFVGAIACFKLMAVGMQSDKMPLVIHSFHIFDSACFNNKKCSFYMMVLKFIQNLI